MDGSDEEDTSNDSEFISDEQSGSSKRKNVSTSRGRRLKVFSGSTSHSSSSSGSSTHASSSSGCSSLSTATSSSYSSARSKPSQAHTLLVENAAASKQKLFLPKAARPHRKRLDSNLLANFDLIHRQAIWNEHGRAPCPVAGCLYGMRKNRVADDRRHYTTHSKDQPIWVCSEELDQVLASHPNYRLPGHSIGGCETTFTRKDAVLRHIRDGTCAH